MPKNKVIDLITDQEMAFARLVLSGTMNDRDAAQAAGLKPDAAAYTKAKPRVREYMLEHRAAVQQLLVEQEAAHEAEELRLRRLRRERILDRLFVIADASPETTRGGFTSQVKALALIAAMDGQIPDRRAGSSTSPQRAASPQRAESPERAAQSTPGPDKPQIYQAAWLRNQQEKTNDPESSPALAQEEEEPALAETEPESEPASAGNAPPLSGINLDPSESTLASAPDTRVSFSRKKNRFSWRR